jgi:GDP-4-dehydro-6-deoxy-D-mannose reductase
VTRILITGGTGFVGPHLIDHLKHGDSAIAVLASGDGDKSASAVSYYEADIRDRDAVSSVLREFKPERIFHLAGISDVESSWKDPRFTYEVNFWGTLNLFEAAAGLPEPPRILNVSTAQVYAPSMHPLSETNPVSPDNPYAVSKAMTELLMVQHRRQAKGGVVTARSFNHTGPGQSAKFVLPSIAKQFAEIEAGLRPARLQLGKVNVRRDFSDVRDVVRAYSLLLERGMAGQIYNVCSGTAVQLSNLIAMFESISGVKVEIETDPGKVRSGEAAQICGDPTKISAATGWWPEIPLRKTLSDLLEYYKSRISSEVAQAPATER